MFNAKFYLMVTDNPFGELVTKFRLVKNLSQRELAQKIGKSATYINYVERGFNPSAKGGKFQPSKEIVDVIAKVLEIDINEARLKAGYAPIDNQPNLSDVADDEFAALFYDSRNWSTENREDALETAKDIFRRYQARERAKKEKELNNSV